MILNMILSKNEAEDLLLSIAKICETLINSYKSRKNIRI